MSHEEPLPRRFAEGQLVARSVHYLELQLGMGDEGRIWALYLTEPPGYEVEFRCRDGQDLSMVCWEHELAALDAVPKVQG